MNTPQQKWLPVIDENLCTGCSACVGACGPKSLEMQDQLAVLARPDTCGSEEHCVAPCPTAAIQMAWVTLSGDLVRGKWRSEPTTGCGAATLSSPSAKGTQPQTQSMQLPGASAAIGKTP